MSRLIILIVVLFAGALPITGVAQDTNRTTLPALVGKTWTLVALQGQEVSTRPALTIVFEDSGAIRGSTGCSEYESTYSIEDAAIQIMGSFSATSFGCSQAAIGRANAFAVALGRADAYIVDSGRLSLRDRAGVETAAFVPFSHLLSDNAWQITAYNNGEGAIVGVLDDTQITASFGDDGQITGSAGCNNYFADFEAGDSILNINQPGVTRQLCAEPGGIMEQEALFLSALASTVDYRSIGNVLTLRGAGGVAAVSMEAASTLAPEAPAAEIAQVEGENLQPLTEQLVAQFDQRLADIRIQSDDLVDINDRFAASEGLAIEVRSARADRLWTSKLRQTLSLAADVISQKDNGKDVSKYWSMLSALLTQVPIEAHGAILRLRARAKLPSPDLGTSEFVIADQKLFREMQHLDELYITFASYLDVAARFDIEVSGDRVDTVNAVIDSAANRSVFLEMAQIDVQVLRSSVATLPNNAELAEWLRAAQARAEATAKAMQSVVNVMNALQIETRQYRQQILTATGEITTDVLDVGIVSGLIMQWTDTVWQALAKDGVRILFRLLFVLLIVFVFFKIATFASEMANRALSSSRVRVSSLLQRMIISSVRNIVTFIGLLIAISQFGISLAPLLAGLGIAGFIIGFALQDSLANFASGMLILLYRPFDVGDFVEAGGVSGQVSHMSLVNTTFMTLDNKRLVVPNNMIWQSVITNVTAQRTRRVDLVFGISYADDIEKAERVLLEVVQEHEHVLDNPKPNIRVFELGESSVNFIVRPWVKTDKYWDVYWDLTRAVKLRFDQEGISIPFPQRDVHVIEQPST